MLALEGYVVVLIDRGCHQVLTGAETVTIGLGRRAKMCEGSTCCS